MGLFGLGLVGLFACIGQGKEPSIFISLEGVDNEVDCFVMSCNSQSF